MTIWNFTPKLIDFLRLPRPQGERRKSICSPWGWGKKIDFQAAYYILFIISDSNIKYLTFNFFQTND